MNIIYTSESQKGRFELSKRKSKFVCQACGYETPKWLGKCPGCQSWNTFVEETVVKGSKNRHLTNYGHIKRAPEQITMIETEKEPRVHTRMKEFNRVLGGGIVPGALV